MPAYYNNRSISCRPENSELWVALVEKAFAKFFGSYKNIIGGDCIWALLNLTGGFTFDVKDFRSKNSDVSGVRNFHNCFSCKSQRKEATRIRFIRFHFE